MTLLMLAAHAVTVGLARYRHAAVRHSACTSAVSVALVSPLLSLSATQRARCPEYHDPRPRRLDLYHDYFGATFAGALLVTACAAAAVVPATTPDKPPGTTTRSTGPAGSPLDGGTTTTRPGRATTARVAHRLPLYQDRYVLYGPAGAALLAGAGAAGRPADCGRPPAGADRAPGAALCLFACSCNFPAKTHAPARSREFNFGRPSFYLAAHSRPGDAILFMNSFYRKAELAAPPSSAGSATSPRGPAPAAASFEGTNKPCRRSFRSCSPGSGSQ